MLERKFKSILNWPLVSFPKDARIFLGLVGAYGKFILNLEELAAPLNKLIIFTKPEFDSYTDDEQNSLTLAKAMECIKAIVIADSYLVLLMKGINNFIIRTDASDFGIGATLRQIQPT
jgi:hypothetical protein